MRINSLNHYCVVKEGSLAGNKVIIEVTKWNYTDICGHCSEQLATTEKLVEHIYDELTSS